MNGVFDSQISGNVWGTVTHVMLHEHLEHSMATYPSAPEQRPFLIDFEQQMQQFEQDYRIALAEIRRLYVMPTDPSSVLEFLSDHRALPQILIDAIPHLRKHFDSAVLALRASADEFGWRNLYTDVLWPGDARSAIRLLDQFEDEWWIPNCRPARGALTFTYRLV